MGIVSLVFGILSIIIAVFMGWAGFSWIGIIMGIVGIILGAIDKRENPINNGIATGGLVCSIIGTIINLLMFAACIACIGILATA